ncbi:TlpA family protein disulfide reductase [Aminipila butyrica]|uniref:TlpA family protein disulfide reductase n=1 Tax=Aminipila butyrica TaxID=433296 RepID=A0A858BVH7_9FIRM|nr:TlpA disulfide reductase family protein [Aminipila butyrica]QIB69422.1 TlpA family protein disulfide reductase [Aminipila butyrica]
MKRLFLLGLAALLTLSMLSGCSQPATDMQLDKEKDGGTNTLGVQDTIQPVASKTATSVGDFKAQDLAGNTVTKDIFSNYDLTLVNVFTTWCSPCIEEIPELNEVYKEMADKKVNVIGIVLDVNEDGKIDSSKMDKLNKIIESTKAEYMVLLPDDVLRTGLLKDISSVPQTFFVDKDGNIVGETYLGSRNKSEWLKVIETEQKNLGS